MEVDTIVDDVGSGLQHSSEKLIDASREVVMELKKAVEKVVEEVIDTEPLPDQDSLPDLNSLPDVESIMSTSTKDVLLMVWNELFKSEISQRSSSWFMMSSIVPTAIVYLLYVVFIKVSKTLRKNWIIIKSQLNRS